VRLRLTSLYGGLFLVSGAGVLAITYWLVDSFLASLSPLKTLGLTAAVGGPSTPLPHGAYSAVLQIGPQGPDRVSPGQVAGPPVNISLAPGSVFVVTSRNALVLSPKQLAAQAVLQHNSELHQLLVRSSIALAIVAVVSAGFGWLVAGRSLRPLRVMATKAQHISEENLHDRLALVGPRDELKDLGDTFDGLLARLEGAFEAQRNFVANASHELRTPLTLIRARLQMRLRDPDAGLESYRTTCEQVLASTYQQEDLIESLLTLARSQRGVDEGERFNLADVVSGVIEAYESTATTLGLRLNASLNAALVWGDAGLVGRLVSNLVDNACRYNAPEGSVEVVVELRNDRAVFGVTNTGPVVPQVEVERLLQPFQRLAGGRGTVHDGLGLGLAIATAVANAHGAALEVQARPGGGLSVEVGFPDRPHSGSE
jgi:signal transduction histidine kinase